MRQRLGILLAAMVLAGVAPAASYAAPSDLDPFFGSGGVAQGAPGKVAQGRPIVQADGKVVVVGVSAGKVVIERFKANGERDLAFGTNGEIVTDVTAPNGRVAVADAGGGAFHIVGVPASGGSKVVLERFKADGSLAPSDRVAVNVPGSLSLPAAAVVGPGGSTYVANKFDCGSGVQCFGVLKFKGSGLDSTFGSSGYVKTKVGSSSEARAIALTSTIDGQQLITVAGSVAGSGSDASDTALVRYLPTGAVDPSFGIKTLDLSGGKGAPDAANGIVGEPGGGVTVAGTAGSTGYAASFTSTGAADGTFPEIPHKPGAIAKDGAGNYVIAGHATDPLTGTTRWTLSRLDALRSFDTGFGSGGTRQYSLCSNTSGHGPTGVTIANGLIHVALTCGSSPDTRAAAARVISKPAFDGGASLSVTPETEAAGHERVPLTNIDPTTVLGAVNRLASAPLGSGPLGSGPLGSGPLGSGPLGSGPLGSGPLGSGPLGSGPLGSGPLGSGPLGSGPLGSGPINEQILLSELPLLDGKTWHELLAPYYPDGVPPLQTITLADVYRLAPAIIDSLTYEDVDITRTPLRRASLAAVLLTRPLQDVHPPAGGWCEFLRGKPLHCPDGAEDQSKFLGSTTLLQLEFAGDDLSAYYAQPLLLSRAAGTDLGTGSGRAMLAYLDLRQVQTSQTPIGALPASALGSLMSCHPSCTGTVAAWQAANVTNWTNGTIGDLVARLPLDGLPDLSLGQLLTGLVNPGEIPYEQADRKALLAAAELRAGRMQTYTVGFKVDCQQRPGLELVPQLPDDARLVPGSATVAVDGGTAKPLADATRRADGKLAYALASQCTGTGLTPMDVAFQAEPGSELGPKDASVLVRSDFGQVTGATKTTVDDSLDPGNGPNDTRELTTAKLVHGWIADADDVDSYSFRVCRPADPDPCAEPGTRVSITLSHLPADYDVQVYGPVRDLETTTLRSGPLGSGPLGSGPLGSGALPDSTGDAIDPAIVEPDRVQDGALGSGPLGSGPLGSGPLGSGSINRGTHDEAVTFRVRRADQGGTITVRVAGYNGEADPRPYVLRRSDIVAPKAPECPSRDLSGGGPGQWPDSISSDAQVLYLVNRQRLRALNTSEQAERQTNEVMSGLAALAAETHGVVLPVESSPDVPTGPAYTAWDDDPCNAEKANTVVERINAVVDAVREANGGLEELRSIVLVGPDAVMPQARLRDETVLSNEDEYANDALFGGNDDAVSGALRQGYLLTDDGYGDFDMSPTMLVPDVALGRLIETAPEIAAQIRRYIDTQGVIRPQDAKVMGYDLFADGSDAEAKALGVTSRNDAWSAADALAAINRPSTGYSLVNAHYDHWRALPSAAFIGTQPDLLMAADAEPNPGSILFTMGCHSGLNVSAVAAEPGDDVRLEDWPQRMAQQNVLWSGSTTFSYGDTEVVAYTEQIMADAAATMAARTATVGQAFMYAKQAGLAKVGVLDAYYVKASQATTFYGLPMYRLGDHDDDGLVGPPTLPSQEAGRSSIRSSDPVSLSLSGRIRQVSVPRGTYFQVGDEEPLVVQNHPIQPLTSEDVTKPGEPARGYLIEGLRSEDKPAGNLVIARPTVDLAAHEPEPIVGDAFFPATLASITREATPKGFIDRLTVAAGQVRGDRQRLFGQIDGRVLRATGPEQPPVRIARVDGTIAGSAFAVRVEVEGGAPVGGNLLYLTDADVTDADAGNPVTWHRADLAVIGDGLLGTGGTLPSGKEIREGIVQVYNRAGRVSTSDYKGENFRIVPLAAPGAGDPRVIVDPDPGDGHLNVNPQIALDPGRHTTATFQSSIDGGPWTAYTLGSKLKVPEPADGEHLVEFRGSDGSSAARRIAIDRAGPTVVAEADRPPNAQGWYDRPVTISFTCADAVSGVESCPAPVTLPDEGAGQSVTATATDGAGHTGTGGLSGINIDLTAPTVTAVPRPAPNAEGWYVEPVTVDFDCRDALSLVQFCSAPQTLSDEGADQSVTGRAVDNAGHSATTTLSNLDVDLTDPSIVITTPGDAILIAGRDLLKGEVSHTTKGSGLDEDEAVRVTYKPDGFGQEKTVTATLKPCTENPPGLTTCPWEAQLPSVGSYTVKAKATEVSGRHATYPVEPATHRIKISVNPEGGTSSG